MAGFSRVMSPRSTATVYAGYGSLEGRHQVRGRMDTSIELENLAMTHPEIAERENLRCGKKWDSRSISRRSLLWPSPSSNAS